MPKQFPVVLVVSLSCALSAGAESGSTAAARELLKSWPQWRGPLANGVAPDADPPVHWSETRNVRWKVPLPGKGHSTPIVFGERLFLTVPVPRGDPVAPVYDRAPGT